MTLEPYIFFYGKCEAALEAYKTIFNGTADMMRIAGSPGAEHTPPEHQNAIMHASFKGDGIAFMASDGNPAGTPAKESNISLSLSLADRKEADRLFAALSEGGKAEMPMAEQFWGAYFGQCTDRFGIDWMINCE